jgi:iron complex outermembrane receptor protein
MIQKKQLAVAIAASFVVSGLAVAQSQSSQPQKVEKVEVTGSNIKRVDSETVAPIEVITREQIERSGKVTVSEVLRDISINSGNSYSESFTNSFAPGASGISLRGLGQKATLVLLNGRRTAGYGFAQNLQDSFVDLNSIPASAIERIEVLKDGASAIYGSDAIAGVVNIIMRKDYQGAELSVSGGEGANNGQYRVTGTFGAGNIAQNGFNVLGVVEYFKRDLIMLNETPFGKTRDYRGEAGGRNFESLTGAGTWRQLSAAGALTNVHRASESCRGSILTAAEAVERGYMLANNAFNLAGNTFCAKDFNDEFTAMPSTERIGAMGRATLRIGQNMTGFAELGYSNNTSYQKFQAPFFAGTTGLQQTAAGLRPFTYNINFAPGVAGNPFSTAARYVGVFGDMGTRDTEVESETIRGLAGLRYTFGNWDGETAVGFSRNEVSAFNFNRLRIDGVSRVFGVGTGPQPPVPTSTSSQYNLNNFRGNTAASRDAMRANFARKATSELTSIDSKLSTELMQLPAGPLGLALGVEYRSEKIADVPDSLARAGLIMGQGITATDGSRNNVAVFAEAGVPILRTLEAQLAVRHDRYSDYGNSTVPKAGLKWTPTSNLVLRANYGEGFRAPTLPEISPSVATFFTSVIDPLDGVSRQISGVFAGNPTLRPEKSKSGTIGVVFEPSKDFNVSLDWYDLKWRDIVSNFTLQQIVNTNGIIGGQRVGTVTRDPDSGQVVSVETNYVNLSEITTNGVDIDARYRMATSFGRVGVNVGFSYITSYKVTGTEVAGTNLDGSLPRVRGSVAFNVDRGAWRGTLTTRYVHRFVQTALPASYFTPQDPRFQTGVYGAKVGSRTYFDLFGAYRFSPKFEVTGSVVNLANKKPPYDPGASGTFLYDFTQHDPRGRMWRVGANYTFR